MEERYKKYWEKPPNLCLIILLCLEFIPNLVFGDTNKDLLCHNIGHDGVVVGAGVRSKLHYFMLCPELRRTSKNQDDLSLNIKSSKCRLGHDYISQ